MPTRCGRRHRPVTSGALVIAGIAGTSKPSKRRMVKRKEMATQLHLCRRLCRKAAQEDNRSRVRSIRALSTVQRLSPESRPVDGFFTDIINRCNKDRCAVRQRTESTASWSLPDRAVSHRQRDGPLTLRALMANFNFLSPLMKCGLIDRLANVKIRLHCEWTEGPVCRQTVKR